ncbi:MAG: hypothetical protein ABIB98_01015 [bacterium]
MSTDALVGKVVVAKIFVDLCGNRVEITVREEGVLHRKLFMWMGTNCEEIGKFEKLIAKIYAHGFEAGRKAVRYSERLPCRTDR